MNFCSKALSKIAKAILFENIEIISINRPYTQNSTIYHCLKSLVEHFIAKTLMVDFFVLGGETTQSSGSYFCFLGVDCVLSSLIK